jgi:hypothetical protein
MKTLDAEKAELKVEYCIPSWQRDEQIKMTCTRYSNRVIPTKVLHTEPIALVCFGPSLNQTWEEIKKFKYVMSCSGSHKFLREKGITPTWHIELDPRPHKIQLIGDDISTDTEFLMASCIHPKVFDHLEKHNAKINIWHTYSGENKATLPLVYPRGDWVLTGGANVGLRAMVMCRFLGFTNLHIFGMDGSFPETGELKHASFHPNICKNHIMAEYEGKQYATTTAFLECARMTFHEVEQLPDCHFTFYGEGLVQDMAKKKVIKRNNKVGIAFHTSAVISELYRKQNIEMHEKIPTYGTVSALRHTDTILKIYNNPQDKFSSILDYGCGKGMLAKNLDFPIWEYDPAIPGKDACPRPADLVVCIDTLEHIEPEYLDRVLEDIYRCTKKIAFFAIGTKLAQKTLPDGRNTHLTVENKDWWINRLSKYFIFHDNGVFQTPGCNEFTCVVAPKPNAPFKKNPGVVLDDKDCLCVVV